MRAVMGILVTDGGTVAWDGGPVSDDPRRRFGYMPEERGFYKTLGVREHLIYLDRLHGLSAGDAAASAERWVEELGLGERAGNKIEELSLGNQQRVQLGGALVHRLTLVTAYGLIRLAGRVYTGSVLHFGPKVKIRQVLRSG